MTARRILFLVAHAPQRGALAFELLDALLVGAVFDQHVSVLFVGDGVYQLFDPGARPSGVPRNAAHGYRALPAYDVNDVYVDKTAMRDRGIGADALVLPARLLTRRGVRDLIATQDVVVPD
jgi:tRNA 2-thiouridine synthesizing protein C